MLIKVFQDWTANKSNIKGKVILVLYRIAHITTSNVIIFIILLPYLVFYRLLVEWFLNCEIPYKTKIGKSLSLFHGHALVINDSAVIGNNCTIRHSTTIGNKKLSDGSYSKSPTIGNNVDIGSNVCVIGPITIGDNVIIGAGSVVVHSVPPNSVIAGNPARIIKTNIV